VIISWRKKVDHLLLMLKNGSDPRESGICWAIIGLWTLGLPVNLKEFNSQFDLHSRCYLVKKAQIELVISYTKFLTYKDNDFFG